jgi:hypothetical protein
MEFSFLIYHLFSFYKIKFSSELLMAKRCLLSLKLALYVFVCNAISVTFKAI